MKRLSTFAGQRASAKVSQDQNDVYENVFLPYYMEPKERKRAVEGARNYATGSKPSDQEILALRYLRAHNEKKQIDNPRGLWNQICQTMDETTKIKGNKELTSDDRTKQIKEVIDRKIKDIGEHRNKEIKEMQAKKKKDDDKVEEVEVMGALYESGPVGDLPLHQAFLLQQKELGKELVTKFYRRPGVDGKLQDGVFFPFIDKGINRPYQSDLDPWKHLLERTDVPLFDDGGLYTGETVLHIAIVQNDLELVKWMLKERICITSRATGSFFKPPTSYIEREVLGDTQANLEPCSFKNASSVCDYGEFPLSFAASVGNVDIMTELAKHAEHGGIPKAELIEVLKSQRKIRNMLKIKDEIVVDEDGGFMRLLIGLQDSRGNTAMHKAVQYERRNVVDWIMKNHGEQLLQMLNADGFTPLTLAVSLGHQSLYHHILSKYMQTTVYTYGDLTLLKQNLKQIDSYKIENDALHGHEKWRSALQIIVQEEIAEFAHDTSIVDLLNEKWNKFARKKYVWGYMVPYGLFVTSLTAVLLLRTEELDFDARQRLANEPVPAFATAAKHSIRIGQASGGGPDFTDIGIDWRGFLSLALHCALVFLGVPWLLWTAHALAVPWQRVTARTHALKANSARGAHGDGKGHASQIGHARARGQNMASSELDLLWQKGIKWCQTNVPVLLLCLISVLMVLSAISRGLSEHSFERHVLALGIISTYIQLLWFLLPFKNFGIIVISCVKIVSGDVSKFIFIYFFIVAGFSLALSLMFVKSPAGTMPPEARYATYFPGTLVYEFWIALDDLTLDNILAYSQNPQAAQVIHIFYIMLFNVLGLNLIIAMMNKTFTSDQGDVERVWLFPWGELVLKIEANLTKSQSRKSANRCGEPPAAREKALGPTAARKKQSYASDDEEGHNEPEISECDSDFFKFFSQFTVKSTSAAVTGHDVAGESTHQVDKGVEKPKQVGHRVGDQVLDETQKQLLETFRAVFKEHEEQIKDEIRSHRRLAAERQSELVEMNKKIMMMPTQPSPGPSFSSKPGRAELPLIAGAISATDGGSKLSSRAPSTASRRSLKQLPAAGPPVVYRDSRDSLPGQVSSAAPSQQGTPPARHNYAQDMALLSNEGLGLSATRQTEAATEAATVLATGTRAWSATPPQGQSGAQRAGSRTPSLAGSSGVRPAPAIPQPSPAPSNSLGVGVVQTSSPAPASTAPPEPPRTSPAPSGAALAGSLGAAVAAGDQSMDLSFTQSPPGPRVGGSAGPLSESTVEGRGASSSPTKPKVARHTRARATGVSPRRRVVETRTAPRVDEEQQQFLSAGFMYEYSSPSKSAANTPSVLGGGGDQSVGEGGGVMGSESDGNTASAPLLYDGSAAAAASGRTPQAIGDAQVVAGASLGQVLTGSPPLALTPPKAQPKTGWQVHAAASSGDGTYQTTADMQAPAFLSTPTNLSFALGGGGPAAPQQPQQPQPQPEEAARQSQRPALRPVTQSADRVVGRPDAGSLNPSTEAMQRANMKKVWVQEVVNGGVLEVEMWVPDDAVSSLATVTPGLLGDGGRARVDEGGAAGSASNATELPQRKKVSIGDSVVVGGEDGGHGGGRVSKLKKLPKT